MTKATLIATLTTPPSLNGAELRALPQAVQCLEVRADAVGDIPVEWLRNHFHGRLLYSLRSGAEGGCGPDTSGQRQARLCRAAQQYDLVALEAARDLLPTLLTAIPRHQRLISWHGPVTQANELAAHFMQLSRVGAELYKLVVRVHQPADVLAPLLLLKRLGRSDTVAFATGRTGFWSRVVAPRLGAPLVFGSVPQTRAVQDRDEPTIYQLIQDYGLPAIPPVDELYGIIGNPVSHSLSPRLHNAAYRALGRSALYVPFHVDAFMDFWASVVERRLLDDLGISLRGLTVASPHKERALAATDTSRPLVQRAGSSNLFVRTNNIWTAETTDPQGVLHTLCAHDIQLSGKRAVVVGCGGSGRAVAAALDQAGAQVTVVNRCFERGRLAVQLLGLPFVPLSAFTVEGFSIVVNATSVGRDDNALPFSLDQLADDAVVVDLVYGSKPTPLVTQTRALGCIAIDGLEVLLAQVREQFRLMTGRQMPVTPAQETLLQGGKQYAVQANTRPYGYARDARIPASP